MNQPLRILFVASECAPWVKLGGLADVVAALPRALRALGHDVRIVLPRYGSLDTREMQKHLFTLGVPMGWGDAWSAVWQTHLADTDVPVYFIEHDALFGGRSVYDPPTASGSNLRRFGFFSRASLTLCHALRWVPDVVHAHDWPTALAPVFLNTAESRGLLAQTASVFTVHNLAYQPKFSASELDAVGLPRSVFKPDGLEDFGAVNPMKGGLYHATKLTTVSPTYAREIRTQDGGEGLHRAIDFRSGDLVGILNGIDDEAWDPSRDAMIPANFSVDDMTGKAACKRALQAEFGLEVRDDAPLIAMVSRLSWQKGVDVVLASLDRILATGAQVVALGAGDADLEHALRAATHERFRAHIGYSEGLAHRMEAGADLFLMPSRFEPCGLNQMYSQRYGTLPIVRATGGLADTVDNLSASEGTGFKLWDLTPASLARTVEWAVRVWRETPEDFAAMRDRAMRKDMGWSASAKRYEEVYGWAAAAKTGQRSSR